MSRYLKCACGDVHIPESHYWNKGGHHLVDPDAKPTQVTQASTELVKCVCGFNHKADSALWGHHGHFRQPLHGTGCDCGICYPAHPQNNAPETKASTDIDKDTLHAANCNCDKCEARRHFNHWPDKKGILIEGCTCPECMFMRLQEEVNKTASNSPALPHAKATFDRAFKLIGGDRRDQYGDVRTSFKRIALIWSGILNITITESQVALCMTGLKLAREANGHKEDSIDDACGYLGLLAELNAVDNAKS